MDPLAIWLAVCFGTSLVAAVGAGLAARSARATAAASSPAHLEATLNRVVAQWRAEATAIVEESRALLNGCRDDAEQAAGERESVRKQLAKIRQEAHRLERAQGTKEPVELDEGQAKPNSAGDGAQRTQQMQVLRQLLY